MKNKEKTPYGVVSNGGINLYKGDCLEIMDYLISQNIVVDAIITDPPYGTTDCSWDNIIPFDKMWERLDKLIKENGAVCLFGSELFSSYLRMSNIKNYKYDWYWEKSKPSLYQHAKNRPMRKVENICVFSKSKYGHSSQIKAEKRMFYNPIGVKKDKKKVVTKNYNAGRVTSKRKNQIGKVYVSYTGFPNDVLKFNSIVGGNSIHPTQKPVKLIEYLIKTYTNKNELVLDFTMGSGTTGVACKNLDRSFIGIEKDEKYFKIAKERIENHKVQLEFEL